ncbi:MAG: hypothetical protein PHN99_01645 [Eubacteriales bacterium]|nr:hypothetical protein [Eubacteriales bacterium]MDD4327141.1 hypothetical protein [Eubacteriales bacterium]MDD4716795.1 hypothetical protein [Eubacteriales bacterium]
MERLQWECKVPMIRNRLVTRPVLAAIVPFLAAAGYLIYRSDGRLKGTGEGYALIMLGILLVLTILFWLALFVGKNAPGYIIDIEGIVNYSLPGKTIKNRSIMMFLVFFGYLRGNFVSVQSGQIAYSRQVMKIRWQDIRKARYYPKNRLIIINGGFDERMAVFCNKENYEAIEKNIRTGIIRASLDMLNSY